VGNVLQIVAEAAADREPEELSSIKPETHAASFSVRAVNNDCMPFRPAERGLCLRNTTKVNHH
jgi:hypothetical protein